MNGDFHNEVSEIINNFFSILFLSLKEKLIFTERDLGSEQYVEWNF